MSAKKKVELKEVTPLRWPEGWTRTLIAVWDNWKKKVPQPSARIIDALLLHGDLNTQQLAVAADMHRNKAGLIDKNGGRYSLKKL